MAHYQGEDDCTIGSRLIALRVSAAKRAKVSRSFKVLYTSTTNAAVGEAACRLTTILQRATDRGNPLPHTVNNCAFMIRLHGGALYEKSMYYTKLELPILVIGT